MSLPVQFDDLGVRFGDTAALEGVSFTVEAGTICGLLGRNGAGKTTLLRALAGHRRPGEGRVLIDGEEPYENARLMAETCLVTDRPRAENSMSVAEVCQIAAVFRPAWDAELADHLLGRFGLVGGAKVSALSRGMAAGLAVSVGLASRAAVSIFDEPHLGMDAHARRILYEELLAEYERRPHTMIISSHLIDEVANLLEQVVILDRGRVVHDGSAVALSEMGVRLVGPAAVVDRLVAGHEVIADQRLGGTASVAIVGPRTGLEAEARSGGVELVRIGLQDMFIHLTTSEEGGR